MMRMFSLLLGEREPEREPADAAPAVHGLAASPGGLGRRAVGDVDGAEEQLLLPSPRRPQPRGTAVWQS